MLLHGARTLSILTIIAICLGAVPSALAATSGGSMPKLIAQSATPTPQPGTRILAVRIVNGISCVAATVCQVQLSDQLLVSGAADTPQASVTIGLLARSAAPPQARTSPTPTTATPSLAFSIVTRVDTSGTFSATLKLQTVAQGNYQIVVDGQVSPFAVNIVAVVAGGHPVPRTPAPSSLLALELAALAVFCALCAMVAFWWDARRMAQLVARSRT